jgi:hypothetical protein
LQRGNYETPGHEAQPGVIRVLHHQSRPVAFDQPPGNWTTGRRLVLARWIASPRHPLTARVMVNRIWQYHFGTGLVSTPDDFGARGSRPASPELLDWLAVAFMESGWSVKQVHRLILNAATYRQDGPGASGLPAAFRPGPRRLEAEAIRDAMLDVGGRLDKRLYGPSIPTERRKEGSFGIKAGHEGRFRRSVYISTRRTYVPTFLTLFDEPAMDTNWPTRSRSAIAQQALALMNDPFVLDCAEAFARRVMAEGGEDAHLRLRRAFALAYGREPDAGERALFLAAAEEPNGWRTLCHALITSNEFIYVD